jgi:cobaltochelatase CobS
MDFSGDYGGTQAQNMAYLDRYWPLEVSYPSREDELEILAKVVPGLEGAIHETMVDVANKIRDAYLGKGDDSGGAPLPRLSAPMSTRTVIRWAKLVQFHWPAWNAGLNPFIHAMDRAMGFRLPPEEREAIAELVQRFVGDGPSTADAAG